MTEVRVVVDVVAVVDGRASLRATTASLASALLRGVGAACDATAALCAGAATSGPLLATVLPFLPLGCAITLPISVTAATGAPGEADAAAVATRARVHALLGLPADRPRFRRGAALPWAAPLAPAGEDKYAGVLRDVHVGSDLPSSKVAGGVQHMVQGPYMYFHYLQQRFSDKGWGCAYRSMQTIVSWFKLNQLTERDVPSHGEIQACLVALGDKPPSFVGSTQWIGSTEIGYCLEEMLGVESRYLSVSSGADLPSQGRALAHHFDTVGSPVMMGGGALAFTILGVDYNPSSGECQFLILDPHYTGVDDLKAIQTKAVAMEGYRATPVGWRPASSFTASSFYNLILPQIPTLAV